MVKKKYYIINVIYGCYWVEDSGNAKAIFTQEQVAKYIKGNLEIEPVLIED